MTEAIITDRHDGPHPNIKCNFPVTLGRQQIARRPSHCHGLFAVNCPVVRRQRRHPSRPRPLLWALNAADQCHRPQLMVTAREPLEAFAVQPEGLRAASADRCARRRPQVVLRALRDSNTALISPTSAFHCVHLACSLAEPTSGTGMTGRSLMERMAAATLASDQRPTPWPRLGGLRQSRRRNRPMPHEEPQMARVACMSRVFARWQRSRSVSGSDLTVSVWSLA